MTLTVDEIHVADAPDAWARAGFTVDAAGEAAPCCRVGGVRIRMVGSNHGSGIVGWSLGGLPSGFSGELDGIATARSDGCGAVPSVASPAAPAEHANGVTAIDHVVLLSPDPDRTVAAMGAVGERPRRERHGELLDGLRVKRIVGVDVGLLVAMAEQPGVLLDDLLPHPGVGIVSLLHQAHLVPAQLGERVLGVGQSPDRAEELASVA